MPVLSRIVIYPIKALDGVALSEARIRPGGGLEGDRELAVVDEQGRPVNGKRHQSVHRLRAAYDLGARAVTLAAAQDTPTSRTFHLDHDRSSIEAWLGAYFGFAVWLRHDARGLPDDSRYFGPTVVCTETLSEVASWLPGLDLAQTRRRFRPNLEMGPAAPFWEDRLVAAGREAIPFRIGDVRFDGMEPWPRCVVPTRNPVTGEADALFQRTFVDRRRQTLPAWAPRARFDHFYRLCVGTRVPASEAGKTVRLGDEVTLS